MFRLSTLGNKYSSVDVYFQHILLINGQPATSRVVLIRAKEGLAVMVASVGLPVRVFFVRRIKTFLS